MFSIAGPTWAARAPRRSFKRSPRGTRPPSSMRTCIGSWPATSRAIRGSIGTISRRAGTRWDSTRLMSPERDDNVRYWIATAPVGAASVLAQELAQFGASDIRERSHDVRFQGPLEVGYRACLWSRTATRVLLSLGSVEARSAPGLLENLRRMDWRAHLAPGATLACECSGGNEIIRHTLYG